MDIIHNFQIPILSFLIQGITYGFLFGCFLGIISLPVRFIFRHKT